MDEVFLQFTHRYMHIIDHMLERQILQTKAYKLLHLNPPYDGNPMASLSILLDVGLGHVFKNS